MRAESIFFLAAGLAAAGAASAADVASPATRTAVVVANPVFDLSLSIGVMSARANETVYATRGDGSGLPPGARISQLNWTTQASGMAGLTLGWNALPLTRIEASLYVPFSKNDSNMTDTDWLSADALPNWTDQSRHPDTRGGRTYIADIKIARQFYAIDDFAFHALAGFRRTEMAWKAYGGTFVYTEASADDCAAYGSRPPSFNAGSDFRNCAGAFDPVAQIAYRQAFNTPYLGLRGVYANGPWKVTGDLIGTPFVWSADTDVHIGATAFKESFRQQGMVGANVQASYQFTPVFAFFVEADGQWYFNRKGESEAWDLATGDYTNYGPGSAGISLRTSRLAAGVKASF
ncbi:MAG: omptin family outer membrane protease [Beijerinckiaceae bacterium]|nr:omptin family outer membrane protease [Beijerinckiaceae bacterium]